VSVRLRRVPGAVALSIADRGAGIAPDEQRRIFERFYRAESARRATCAAAASAWRWSSTSRRRTGPRRGRERAGAGRDVHRLRPVAPIVTPAPEERVAS
jgi:hypothetical protein